MLWTFTILRLHNHIPTTRGGAAGGPNPASAIPRLALHAIRPPPLEPARQPPLSLLADRCVSMRQLKQVHAQMIVSARISDNYAASRLLSFAALSPSGDLPHALRLFRATPTPNSFMWNTLIRALAASPSPAAAIALFSEMLRLGPPPGKHTFPFLLKACAGLPSSPDIAPQVHAHILKRGLHEDPYVVNGLVRCYGVHGHLGDARELFDGSPQKNPIVWTTMISTYAQNFCSNEALFLFDQMIRAGVEPCDATLSSVLSACARSGGLDLGQQIHSLIRQKGIKVGVILGTALVDMYAKNGAMTAALELFEQMPEKNTATWNAVICGLAHHGHANAAIELFLRLQKEHVRPNDVTLVGVLTACCHAGFSLLEVGRRIFYSMETMYDLEPKLEHYGCMVDLLGRCGNLSEAERLIKGMKWGADVVVWGALLSACKNHGNIEIAERVVNEMLRLDPGNHGVYVVLSNMYAEVGRWKDVTRLRKVMKIVGLKKIPAWSCVEGDASPISSTTRAAKMADFGPGNLVTS
ncbi:pentatricopeptide repeat-containing protein [Canna indica]|uniref:Pentatricopeptide repeat-containing protein n=1 Tax=Canna indica TaxID=4628 RepID=A0AAQ3Q6M9_9LILI|nr:pentatricopeptide repeat-containing protein [Canna indica]